MRTFYKKIEIVVIASLLAASISGCGNKKKDDTSYLQFEHVYGNVVETVEIADSEGFYPIDDYVYISSDDAVILSSASALSITNPQSFTPRSDQYRKEAVSSLIVMGFDRCFR